MPIAVYFYVLIQLVIISYYDIRYQKIKNMWFLSNYILFIPLYFIFRNYYIFSIEAFILPLGFMVIGFLFFLINIMGGGDSKYLSSLYLLVPEGIQLEVFNALIWSTIVIAGGMFLRNIVLNYKKIYMALIMKEVSSLKGIFGKKFAFAPVVLVSWILFAILESEKISWKMVKVP